MVYLAIAANAAGLAMEEITLPKSQWHNHAAEFVSKLF